MLTYLVIKSKSVVAQGKNKGRREGLQRGMKKFLGVMILFILIVVMISWVQTCHNLSDC